MLSARRDPVFDQRAHNPSLSSRSESGGQAGWRPTGFARLIGGVQILGTVLAIPVGLASGYSIYRANFSPEATCGGLRANIISMLDKNADASTLRLLVRKDVASFERSCAAVDPDAVAAFKTLLVRPARVGAVASAGAPAEAKSAPAGTAAVAPRPGSVGRVAEPTKPAKGETTRAAEARSSRTTSDADWLAAVRHALLKDGSVGYAVGAEGPLPLMPPAQPLPAEAAPPLPPTASVAPAPAPRATDDHPVPPAPIPNIGSR